MLLTNVKIKMEKLGFIVSDRKIQNMKGFVELTNDISNVDSTKPILIVGLKNAKNIIGHKFNILNKKVNDTTYWTFKKTEKRDDYEADLKLFYQRCLNIIVDNIKYNYINIIILKYNKIKKLYNILFNDNKNYIYINNNMIYCLYNSNHILGISLSLLDYCGIKPSKIIDKLKQNKGNIIYDDETPFVHKIKREFSNKEYAIPYFMSME